MKFISHLGLYLWLDILHHWNGLTGTMELGLHANAPCFRKWKVELVVTKERKCCDGPFCCRSSAWTFPSLLPAWSGHGRVRDVCLYVCDNDWAIVRFISGTSLFLPKLAFARAPQSTWTDMTNFGSWRKDRDLSHLLREGSQNPSTNVSILVSAKIKLHWAIERGWVGRSSKLLFVGYPGTNASNFNSMCNGQVWQEEQT